MNKQNAKEEKEAVVKQDYISPELEVIRIEMESGIVASSITRPFNTIPSNVDGKIMEEWETTVDENSTINL